MSKQPIAKTGIMSASNLKDWIIRIASLASIVIGLAIVFLAPNGIWRMPGIVLTLLGANWAAKSFGVDKQRDESATLSSGYDAKKNNREMLVAAVFVIAPLCVLYLGREEYLGFHKSQ